MLRRILILAALAFAPAAALALPAAPPQPAAHTVTGALLDKVTKTTTSTTTNKAEGISGYVLDFHDDKYQYSLPVCGEFTMVETTGASVEPSALGAGDTLTVSVQPNPKTAAKSCVNRVVRQQVNRGSSHGECLQHFQVKQEVQGAPERLVIKTEYVYLLTIYARPTLDCDAKAYGSSPITTVVAKHKPFIVTLQRDTPEGTQEIMRRTLTTDADGHAQFVYTFTVPSDSYKFQIAPGGNATPGDVIGWDAKVVDPNPSPSPAPAAAGGLKLSTTPILIAIFIVFLIAAVAEYWHWVKKKRERELPEQEYQRTPKL